jgi:RNA 2',3'-cyclic 3'-phosphodiesterase
MGAGQTDVHWLGMRLFIGIPLPDAVVRELSAVVGLLRKEGAVRAGWDKLRWTEPASWHITLQFLGSTAREQFECLKARLIEVRSDAPPVQLGELGCFDRVGVLYADVMITPELAALQQKVAAATSTCGFVAETRPFHPHITLARNAGNRGPGHRGNKVGGLIIRAVTEPAFTPFTAREFVLYESHLRAGGAQYEIRQRFALRQPQR